MVQWTLARIPIFIDEFVRHHVEKQIHLLRLHDWNNDEAHYLRPYV